MKDNWKCVKCGIEISGRVSPSTGEIHASDQPPSGKTRPAICFSCHIKTVKILAAPGSSPSSAG